MSESGREVTVESEQAQKYNTRWNLLEFARQQRGEFKFNKVDRHTLLFPRDVEAMAEEFPELELTPFQKQLLLDSLEVVHRIVLENAVQERDTKPGPDQGDSLAIHAQIESTLLQVYSFLHNLETDRTKG